MSDLYRHGSVVNGLSAPRRFSGLEGVVYFNHDSNEL